MRVSVCLCTSLIITKNVPYENNSNCFPYFHFF